MTGMMTSTRIVGSADTRALTVAVVGAGSWVGHVHIFADSGLRLDDAPPASPPEI